MSLIQLNESRILSRKTEEGLFESKLFAFRVSSKMEFEHFVESGLYRSKRIEKLEVFSNVSLWDFNSPLSRLSVRHSVSDISSFIFEKRNIWNEYTYNKNISSWVFEEYLFVSNDESIYRFVVLPYVDSCKQHCNFYFLLEIKDPIFQF